VTIADHEAEADPREGLRLLPEAAIGRRGSRPCRSSAAGPAGRCAVLDRRSARRHQQFRRRKAAVRVLVALAEAGETSPGGSGSADRAPVPCPVARRGRIHWWRSRIPPSATGISRRRRDFAGIHGPGQARSDEGAHRPALPAGRHPALRRRTISRAWCWARTMSRSSSAHLPGITRRASCSSTRQAARRHGPMARPTGSTRPICPGLIGASTPACGKTWLCASGSFIERFPASP
jgi:hypothetical protein